MKDYTELAEYLLKQAEDFTPPKNHLQSLETLAEYMRQNQAGGKTSRLNFICTHNSRRSHFGQVMAQVLAAHLGFKVQTYSGGTEATAFNANAVTALRELGVAVERLDDGVNPHYRVVTGALVSETFSKVFSAEPNPQREFAAIMVCSSADAGCPFVPGAEKRISLPFEDPKISDGTPQQAATYRERALEMGKSLAWAFRRV